MENSISETREIAQFIRVPTLTEAAASKPVPLDYDEITGWREIRPIKGAKPYDVFVAAPVSGDSLKDENIRDGDWLVILLTHKADLGDLVVALTPWGRVVKFWWPQEDGYILLKGANPEYEDLCFWFEDVKIQGIVKRIERDL